MIMTLVAGLAVLSPSTPDGQWGPASFSAEALAKRVDNKLATLVKAKVRYRYVYDKAAVGHAEALCDGTIVGPNRFWFQVPSMDLRQERNPFNYELWIADGKNFGRAIEPKNPAPGPLASRPRVPAHPLDGWFTDFSRVILAGVGSRSQPFGRLAADAHQRGYKAVAETRAMTYQGHRLTSHRMVFSKGASRIEIVVDGHGEVPVSITNTIGKDRTRWTDVDWNLRPGKELDANKARFTKSAEGRDTAPKPRPH